MNMESRFDHIVGLIYTATRDSEEIAPIVDAIGSELAAISGPSFHFHAQRQFIQTYVNGAAGSAQDSAIDVGSTAVAAPSEWSADADRFLRRLSVHLANAAAMRDRARQQEARQAIREIALSHLPFGLVWIGPELGVLSVNEQADRLLAANEGLSLCQGRLRAWVQSDTAQIDRALRAAICPNNCQGQLLAIRRPLKALPLLATVIPVSLSPSSYAVAKDASAIVILQNPDESAPVDLAHLHQVFGFTAAERGLAEALVNNETLENYADRLSVSRNTVRSHLARLFKKTATTRQAELVRLLMLARPRI